MTISAAEAFLQRQRVRSCGISRNASAAEPWPRHSQPEKSQNSSKEQPLGNALGSQSSPGSRMPLPQPAKVQKQKRGWQMLLNVHPVGNAAGSHSSNEETTPSPQMPGRIGW